MQVCVLGDLQDLSIVYIAWLLRDRGHVVHELPEDELGVAWTYQLDGQGRGMLRTGEIETPWDEISGVFVRLNPEPPLPPGLLLENPHRWQFVQERREGLHQLLEHLRCPVVNRPSAGRANAAKPLQMTELRRAGFDVPRWVATNAPDRLRHFNTQCNGRAIYKATSGLRSRVRMVDEQLADRLDAGGTPTVIQEYVIGVDVRVHTVGARAFACRIAGAGVDYRFEHEGARYERSEIPDELAARCCRFAEADGLVLAGFDFRLTDDGRWRCLEMNPVPSFLPYEFSSGLPIGAAIADVLTERGTAPETTAGCA